MKGKNTVYAGVLIILAVAIVIYATFLIINKPVKDREEKLRVERIKKETGVDESSFSDLPLINGRREGCLLCHNQMKGFEKSHDPLTIGCYSCHLGTRLSRTKEGSHKGMILIPGNSSNAAQTCGQPNCHPQMIPRMQSNIMTTMNGVVTVDKWVFEEASSKTFRASIDSIGNSLTDKHLRNLCASCHLSNEKTEYGPITELSRGGGCIACHLNYSKDAFVELKKAIPLHEGQSEENSSMTKNRRFGSYKFLPTMHPNIDLKVTNDHCFGCHSRSGRISLSYEGWHETELKPREVKGKRGFRLLDDGRVVMKIVPDIHSEFGMSCVDCHTSYEIMGDGKYALHKEDQSKLQCIDCHLVKEPATKNYNDFEYESKKIAELENLAGDDRNYLIVEKNQFPLVNVFQKDGSVFLVKKISKETLEVKPPSKFCTAASHQNLTCNSCHNAWTPQCIGCHTEYDAKGKMYDLLANKESDGEWHEKLSGVNAEHAVLGVRELKAPDGTIKNEVAEFAPGMILTIDKKLPSNNKPISKRLYAPGFSHTIRKEVRSCKSCHNNSLALGYGRGKLEYVVGNKVGKWKFTPKYSLSKVDGLPSDAWIGFLKERGYNSTTRDNTRPFSVEEQKIILTVGACLTCHEPNSYVMQSALQDFSSAIKKISSQCILPVWN